MFVIYVLPSKTETAFHTHMKQPATSLFYCAEFQKVDGMVTVLHAFPEVIILVL
jgi:hypothetical protein